MIQMERTIRAHNALEEVTAFNLAKEGISLDQEDKERLKFADDACGEIFYENDVHNMDHAEVMKLVNKVINGFVSEAIDHILKKYDLPHIYGYVIAQQHIDLVYKKKR